MSRALADPVLSFTLQNNEEAFAMNDMQKVEGAEAVHVEETRVRMDVALGKVSAWGVEGAWKVVEGIWALLSAGQ